MPSCEASVINAGVIELARQALGILVGHDVRHRFGDGGAHIVLRGNELDTFELAVLFAPNDRGNLRVGGLQVAHIHVSPPTYGSGRTGQAPLPARRTSEAVVVRGIARGAVTCSIPLRTRCAPCNPVKIRLAA